MKYNLKIWIPVIVALISGICIILSNLLNKDSYFDKKIEESTIRTFLVNYPLMVNEAYSTVDTTKLKYFCVGENLKANQNFIREIKDNNSTMEYKFKLFELQDFELNYLNNIINATVTVKTDLTYSLLRKGEKYRCINNKGTSTFFW